MADWMPMWVEDQLLGLKPGFQNGYDYWNALKFGVQRQGIMNGHMYSRVPQNGLLLKSPSHPTFWKTLAGERDAGMVVSEQQDGRLYSRPREYFGYEVRHHPYEGELKYFKENPSVAGMAAEDGRIVFNPYASSDVNLDAVGANEAARLWMRSNGFDVQFPLTRAQKAQFRGTAYSRDPQAARHSILARIISEDPLAKDATRIQKAYAEYVKRQLMRRSAEGGK